MCNSFYFGGGNVISEGCVTALSEGFAIQFLAGTALFPGLLAGAAEMLPSAAFGSAGQALVPGAAPSIEAISDPELVEAVVPGAADVLFSLP